MGQVCMVNAYKKKKGWMGEGRTQEGKAEGEKKGGGYLGGFGGLLRISSSEVGDDGKGDRGKRFEK